jgi:hypothetical protein
MADVAIKSKAVNFQHRGSAWAEMLELMDVLLILGFRTFLPMSRERCSFLDRNFTGDSLRGPVGFVD